MQNEHRTIPIGIGSKRPDFPDFPRLSPSLYPIFARRAKPLLVESRDF